MATSTISLGKVKFNWKGDWATSTAYVKDDVVKYGPNVYICITAHTSTSTFAPDVAKWDLMVAGLENAGVWNSGTLYQTGQTVTYGGAVYIALRESTNANPYTEALDWQKFVDGQQYEGDYNISTNYQKGDIVYYGGFLYVAKQNTLNNNPTNTTYWDVYIKGYEFYGTWSDAIQYRPGDVVKYGGNRYVCKEGQRPLGIRPTETASYNLITEGFEFKGDWAEGTEYRINDLVKFGGKVYLCIDSFTNSNAPDVSGQFSLFVDGLRWRGNYSNSNSYTVGDIARLGGRSYICIESYDNDGSTNPEPPNSDYWELFADGFRWLGTYNASSEYEIGDVVEYAQSSYVSLVADNIGNTPSDGAPNWSLMAQGDSNAVLTTRGDILTRDGTQAVRLPIGPSGSFLYSDGTDVKWGHLVPQNDYFVSPQGDDTNDGRTATTSWRTLQHAAQQTFSLGQCRINVQAGTYEELCPIRLGRGVVMEGNGLGAVDISPDTTNDKGYGVGISSDGSTPNANSYVFLVNNGTRIRNFVFRNFSTGSVAVSLDPGSGPDDTSVWITSQSPYVQNCTNFTPGGTGMKVDGALHNGGYKSIVNNDFTQINSDGIGVHVLNDGRTEIVSCFTYYCNIGYLAESGGKIRAIVGNNSYGEYGAVARGYSQTEVPLTGKLRLNDKTIDSVVQVADDVHLFTSFRDSIGNRFYVGHTAPTTTNIDSTWDNTASYPVVAKYNSAGSLDWLYTYESNFGAIHSVVELSDRIYCGGVIYDGSNKGFILAISKAGEIQWQKTIGNTTEIVDVTTDDNNLYAVGTHSTNGISVIKTNPAGIESWSRTLKYNDSSAGSNIVPTSCTFAKTPTTSTDTYALAGDATAENNLYVAAYDSNVNEALVIRINSTGGYETTYQYGDVRINDLALDTGNGDGIYLMAAGYYDPAGAVTKNPIAFRLTVDGDVAWQAQVSDGTENGEWKDVLPFGNDIYLSGYMSSASGTVNTGLIARYTSAGVVDWYREVDNSTNNVWFNGIMLDGVNVIAVGNETNDGLVVNIQRDLNNGIGTVTSGSYQLTTVGSIATSTTTVVTKGINAIDQSSVTLGVTDESLTLNTSPGITTTVASTRAGFAGIGTGVLFSVDSLNRQPKDGSVLQIDGDSETYFVIGVSDFLESSFTTGNNTAAQAILTANKTFLQNQIVGWVDAQIAGGSGIWSGFSYDSTTCSRDVGLIVDALISDLDENSNGNTIDSAYAYWNNASGLYSLNSENAQNVATWTYAKSIIDDVLNQSSVTPDYTGGGQVTGLSSTEAGTVTLSENNIQALIDILNGGLSNAPSKTNYGTCQIQIDPAIPSNKTPNDLTHLTFREAFSQVRMSGHDFLDIGTGGFADTNYPVIIASDYTQQPNQDREVFSENGGRCFYVTTDQNGNFRVGDYFKVEQATGRATLSSEEFDLAGLNELQLGSITAGKQGATINEFSTDGTFADNSDEAVPTEKATKTYVDTQITLAVGEANAIVAGNDPTQSKVSVSGSGIASDTIDFDIAGTTVAQIGEEYIKLPTGTTGDRPGTPATGMFRYNTTNNSLEIYGSSAWEPAGSLRWSIVNASQAISKGEAYMVNTQTTAHTITLPGSPALGDSVRIMDYTGSAVTHNITVGRNGNNIMGLAQDLTISTNNAAIGLVYSDATYGWRLIEVL